MIHTIFGDLHKFRIINLSYISYDTRPHLANEVRVRSSADWLLAVTEQTFYFSERRAQTAVHRGSGCFFAIVDGGVDHDESDVGTSGTYIHTRSLLPLYV